MPMRDDYAMIVYGIIVDGDDLAYEILGSHQHLPLDEQSIGDIGLDQGEDTHLIYLRGTKISVGSRCGQYLERFNITSGLTEPLTLIHKGIEYTFSWILVMWGPGTERDKGQYQKSDEMLMRLLDRRF